jgi:hypothetical protein
MTVGTWPPGGETVSGRDPARAVFRREGSIWGLWLIRYSTADSRERESFDPFVLVARGVLDRVQG